MPEAFAGLIYEVPIKGDINSARAHLVEEGIRRATEEGASVIVFSIDTFGGLVDSALRIKRAIVNAPVPTIAFIEERAWSAGALIALSAEMIIMAPGSSMGAAETRPLEEKYISALRGEFKATAEMRGRDPEVAQAMVDVDIEIEGVIASGKLLTLSPADALDLDMVDLIEGELKEAIELLGYSVAQILTDEPTTVERFALLAQDPIISIILIAGGALGIYTEFITPGFALPGTAGVLLFALFFSSRLIAGATTYGVLLLFLAGIILLFLEIFVIPGFGVPGVGGVLAIFFSLFLSFDTSRQAFQIISIAFLLTIVLAILLFRLFGSSSLWKKIVLFTSEEKEKGYIAPMDRRTLLGKEGEALTPLRPTGSASVEGQRLDVVTQGDYIKKGERVEIVKIDGNRLVVQRKEDKLET